jgi:glucokinase
MKKLAVDIGGTWLRWRVPGSEEEGGRVAMEGLELLPFLETLLEKERAEALGISFAGQVQGGRVLAAPNIPLPSMDLAGYLHERTGAAVAVENDLNCAALAEADDWGVKDLVALYSGTGLGAGFVVGGTLIRGEGGMAGELGHIPFREAPFACGCGKRNCVELYASGSGLAKWGAHRGCDAETLVALRDAERPECREIYRAYLEGLLTAAGTAVTLCNPELLVLGGGVIQANPWLLESLRERITHYALPLACRELRIEHSRLANASLRGAELLAERFEAGGSG